MGTMNKLRENTGIVLWILVFAFGVIWVLQDSGGLDAVGQQNPDGSVIVVDGEPITMEEYSGVVEQQVQRFQQSGREMTPQVREQIETSVYDGLIQQHLVEREMNRLGITVSDDEVRNMITGPNPHPMIQRAFTGEDGTFDPNSVQAFLSNPANEPQLVQIENTLRQQRRTEKLTALLGAAVHVTDEDVTDEYRRRNRTANAEYVALPFASVPNGAVEVTDDDLQAFYDEHREDYKRENTYTLSYAALEKKSTKEDSAQVTSDLEALRSDLAEAENDSLFLASEASEQPYSSDYVTPDQMDAAVASAVFDSLEAGKVVGPVYGGGLVHLVKIEDVQPAAKTFVRARHILLRADSVGDALLQRAQSLKDSLEAGADFAALAREVSDDGSAAQGGDLGWFGPGQMAPPFEEAAFGAEPGEIVGPVTTRFGVHLIQVEARTDQQARIADLAYSLQPSVASLNETRNTLENLSVYADEGRDFGTVAEQEGLTVQEATVQQADPFTVPGLGPSRSIERFATTAEVGDISEVIELDDQFVVLRLDATRPEGYRPLEEVQAEIRPQVLREKKLAVQQEKLAEALEQNGFEGLAAAVGAQQRTQTGINFSTQQVPGLGNDPIFVGTVMGLDQGQTSRAVAGQNAAFVARVTEVNEPSEITEAQRTQIRQQLVQQRRQQIQQEWITALRNEAEIEDNRALYNL